MGVPVEGGVSDSAGQLSSVEKTMVILAPPYDRLRQSVLLEELGDHDPFW